MTSANSFKQSQLVFSKVKVAYSEKEAEVLKNITKHGIKVSELEIFLQVFKQEKLVELWAKAKTNKQFILIREFDVCTSLGTLGPKRKEGDMQVPEGFYHIAHFNPESNFYLSLGINYPNASDCMFADKQHPGGAIYIHGNCVTIGCIPITDDKIKELYVYAVEARNNGQTQVPVHIFPCRMNDVNMQALKNHYKTNVALLQFWTNLKQGYDFFRVNNHLPTVSINKNGFYSFR